MENNFKFGTMSILEIGKYLEQKLLSDGITSRCELSISVNGDEFKKIDEDLFYRNGGYENDFIPSEGKISVTIGNVRVNIENKDG